MTAGCAESEALSQKNAPPTRVETAILPTPTEDVEAPTPTKESLNTEATTVPEPEESLITPATVPDGWQIFQEETYGFRFAYPADWTFKEMALGGPGQPGDWPITRFVMFFPQSMEAALSPSGPPDPNAPIVVAPIHMEICVGPDEQLRRVYPEPGSTEPFEAQGISGIFEREGFDDFNVYRYIFTHPDDANVRVVFSDVISGFSTRATETPEFSQLIPLIVTTFEFAE
jgi:hypothetical protein